MNNIRTDINQTIENLYTAQQHLTHEDFKSALGTLATCKNLITSVEERVNNKLFPNDNENGNTTGEKPTSEKETRNVNLHDELEYLKDNLCGFNEDDFTEAYRNGIPNAVEYLLDCADSNASRTIELVRGTEGVTLKIKTDSSLVKSYLGEVVTHLKNLLSCVGITVDNDRTEENGDNILIVLPFKRENGNCYKLSPLVIALGRLFNII